MGLEIKNKTILLDKEKNKLDNFVINFIRILNIKYVLISGYVALLFGRPRTTDDVDLFIEEISFKQFKELYSNLKKAGFETVNVDDENELFDMLKTGHGIRFCEKGISMPNMEVKFASNQIDKLTLKEAYTVLFGKDKLKISPLELQIAYKLYLGKEGNEKDIEDARHLFKIFKDSLDMQKINEWLRHFNVISMVKHLE